MIDVPLVGAVTTAACLALLVAGSHLFEVQLPGGARVALVPAMVISLAVIATPPEVVMAAAAGAGLAFPLLARRRGAPTAAILSVNHAAGALAAVAAVTAGRSAVAATSDITTLLLVVAGGTSYFVVSTLAGRMLRVGGPGSRELLPFNVVLVCAAALFAIAHQHHGFAVAAAVAALPVVVIRSSFERYARALETYRQATEALGLLPEVAGHAPIGHGARTAVYAEVLAEALGVSADVSARVVTAARLHHIGDVTLDGPVSVVQGGTGGAASAPDGRQTAASSAAILRDTGFLAPVAPLVEGCCRPGPSVDLGVAIVRVASSLDEAAGDDASADARLDAIVLGVAARHQFGAERAVAEALLALVRRRPDLLQRGRAASAALTTAAVDGHAAGA